MFETNLRTTRVYYLQANIHAVFLLQRHEDKFMKTKTVVMSIIILSPL